MKTEIIISGKGKRRKKMGRVARRIRNISIFVFAVLFVSLSISWMVNKRRVTQAQLDISRISHATRLFRADFSRCPLNVNELSTPPEGISYIKKVVDPWGRPYQLVCPSNITTDGVDVISSGPDGDINQKDNIKNFVVEATY